MPSTNLSTGLSTKPVTLTPNKFVPGRYIPLSVFFTGISPDEADEDALYGLRMPQKEPERREPEKKKSGPPGSSNVKDQKGKKDDDKDGDDKDAQMPPMAAMAKPRSQASAQGQRAPQGGSAASQAKQESVRKGPWDKPHKCAYCAAPATRDLVWADGRAVLACCDEHRAKAERHIAKQKDPGGRPEKVVAARRVVQENGQSIAHSDSRSIALRAFLEREASEAGATKEEFFEAAQIVLMRDSSLIGDHEALLAQIDEERAARCGAVAASMNRKGLTDVQKRRRRYEKEKAKTKAEGMTTTANVATVPVPIGAGDGRKFLTFVDDDEKKKKRRKKKSLSKRLAILLKQ